MIVARRGRTGVHGHSMNQTMRRRRFGWCWGLTLAVSAGTLLAGCEAEPAANVDLSIAAYRDRMLTDREQAAAVTAADETVATQPAEPRAVPADEQANLPARRTLMVEPQISQAPSPAQLLKQIPDPADAPAVFEERLDRLREEYANRTERHLVFNYQRVVEKSNEYLGQVGLPNQRSMTLAECVQRALATNYAIQIEAHTPAISETRIIEAEAAFDVEFFLDSSYASNDEATANTFVAGTSDTRSINGGFRKLLPTGMQTSVSLGQTRTKNNLPSEYQTMNPMYNSSFIAAFKQPLLRGFGLDVNRAEITIRKLEHRIDYETFIQRVRDTLLNVEQAYWNLASARRVAAILAESVAQNYVTMENMRERLGHDATQVEVANSESRWQSRYVDFLEAVKTVRDAEDRLKNLLNDPELTLAERVEIIPTEIPVLAPVALDQFGEVRTALDRRSEIRQARQRIDSARVQTMVNKNAILPQLDLSFQYEVQGIGKTGDNSFDNLTTARFQSYTVSASFAYDFGERASRAGWRRARLQESQAVVALNQATDSIVEEVNNNVRTLVVRFEQVPPQFSAVQADERNLEALQARTRSIDPSFLETELSAVERLASDRQRLLQVLVDYNLALIQLEKSKGTLLDYNNVVVTDAIPEN